VSADDIDREGYYLCQLIEARGLLAQCEGFLTVAVAVYPGGKDLIAAAAELRAKPLFPDALSLAPVERLSATRCAA